MRKTWRNALLLLPMFAAGWAIAKAGDEVSMPAPHRMAWRYGQELVFLLWLFGVPSLAGGLAFDVPRFVAAGAWCLLTASLVDTGNVTRILRHAFISRPMHRQDVANG